MQSTDPKAAKIVGWPLYRLESIKELTDSAIEMRFATLPNPDGTPSDCGLTVSGSMMFATKGGPNGNILIRKYTPLDCRQKGYTDYLVKVYPDGRGTQWLAALKPGDLVPMGKHPKKDIDVVAAGRPIAMVAGGSGIAPMIQILNHYRATPSSFPQITLYFGGLTEKDLYYRELIQEFAAQFPDKLKVVYSVENPSESWTGPKGYVNADLVKSMIPPLEANPLIVVSAPPRVMEAMVGPKALKKDGLFGGLLAELGFTRKSVWTLW